MNDDASQNTPPEGEQTPQPPPQPPWQPPPPPPPPRPRTRSYLLPISCAVGCLPWLILGLLLIVAVIGGGAKEYGDHVALIRVSGVITAGTNTSSLLQGSITGSESVVEQLEKARTSDDAKAVVIRINSPGGSPAGSEEIYNAIRRLRKAGKPVYASMGDVAASGGYYTAAPCSKIFADASTITGSIGVIFETADLSELFKKIGMNPETIKSGKFKDLGSPSRPLTAEERKLIQGIVDQTYDTFVKAVVDGRKMPLAEVKKLADGRVFTGTQALKLKLVDEIGGMHETVVAAAREGGIVGVPQVVEYRKRGWLTALLGAESAGTGLDRALSDALIERLLREAQSPPNPR